MVEEENMEANYLKIKFYLEPFIIMSTNLVSGPGSPSLAPHSWSTRRWRPARRPPAARGNAPPARPSAAQTPPGTDGTSATIQSYS